MAHPIRLAVVDDSSFVRKAIQRVFQSSEEVLVVGLAASGEELLEHLDEWQPSAITLDLSMPGIGGLATLDRLMGIRRIPVIILSSHSSAEAPLTLEALSRGAADFIDKEEVSLVDFDSIRRTLLAKIRAVTAGDEGPPDVTLPTVVPEPATVSEPETLRLSEPGVIVIGASTGGPPAIERILTDLGTAPAVPIVVVQHMPAGFTAAFAQRLDGKLPFPVREAAHGVTMLPGTVYIAQGGMQLRIRYEKGRLVTTLSRYPETAHRPSVDVLFRSAAQLPFRSIAVLLTGMGSDGARGLLELRRAGAVTLAQDEATSAVYGMPRCARDLGAVQEQLPLGAIAARLAILAGMTSSQA